jgi:hypothetical protein
MANFHFLSKSFSNSLILSKEFLLSFINSNKNNNCFFFKRIRLRSSCLKISLILFPFSYYFLFENQFFGKFRKSLIS